MDKQKRIFMGKVRSVDSEEFTVDVTMSDASIDRYREVIHPKAWTKRLGNYKKHPVLLSSHNYYNLLNQIGKSKKIGVNSNGELEAKMQYFVGKGNPEADWGFFLAEEGIAAYSVGFIPHSWLRKGDDGFEDLAKELGYSKKQMQDIRLIYTEVELLENSQVLVPANANGLQKGLDSKEIQEDPILKDIYSKVTENLEKFKKFFETEDADTVTKGFEWSGDKKQEEGLDTILNKVRSLNGEELIEEDLEVEGKSEKTAQDSEEGSDQGEEIPNTSEKNVDTQADNEEEVSDEGEELDTDIEGKSEEEGKVDKEVKGVIPFKSYSLMDEGASWNGARASRRMRLWAGGPDKDNIDWSKYSKGFTWVDSEDSKNFGAYKLPHHDVVDGELKTHWRGTAAAMGALLGARDGVDVPEADRKGIYNHLSKHYKEFDKEVPEFKLYESMEDVVSGCKDGDTALALIKNLSGIEDTVSSLTLDQVEDSVEKGIAQIDSIIKEAVKTFEDMSLKMNKDFEDKVKGFVSEIEALKSVVHDLEVEILDKEDTKKEVEGQFEKILDGINDMNSKISGE